MRRREVLALLGGAMADLPHAAPAQQTKAVRIGVLNSANPEPLLGLLRDALREVGYAEGRNLRLEISFADGNPALLPSLAADMVRSRPDLIVAFQTPAVGVMQAATRDIPIILLGAGDPVGTGLVESLARPGGNITGTSGTTAEMGAKTLEVMREIIPSVRRVAVLANAVDPFTGSFLKYMELGGQTLHLETPVIRINDANELEGAFAQTKTIAADAVIVQPSLPRERVADLALKHRIPAIAPSAGFTAVGGLVAYSPSQSEMARRSAAIIDKVLKGGNPAEIPVEQPTQFELVINQKTAKAIGLTISPAMLARADQVIE